MSNFEQIDANITSLEPGVPNTYTKMTETGKLFNVQQGGLNKFRLRPQVLVEHAESSRVAQAIVTSTQIVGQYARISQDNINGISLTLESTGGTLTVDNFDAYANSAALQLAWVASGITLATLDNTIVKSGNSMRLDGGATILDTWTKTITSVDKTGGSVGFDIYQTKEYAKLKFSIFIGDGVNTKSLAISGVVKNGWAHIESNLASFVEDGAGVTNEAAITQVGFRLVDPDNADYAYIDQLTLVDSAGNVELKLWNMGTTLPVSATTVLTGQHTQLGDIGAGATAAASIMFSLQGGKRKYNIDDFVAGVAREIPTNTLLTEDNYYAITLHWIDKDVTVYGPDPAYTTDYFTSGYAFTTPNEATAPTQIGTYSDLMFMLYSTQDIYVTEAEIKLDAVPSTDVALSIFAEDSSMVITDIVTGNEIMFEQSIHEDISSRPVFMEKGGKFECYYNSDGADSVQLALFEMRYFFEPPVPYT